MKQTVVGFIIALLSFIFQSCDSVLGISGAQVAVNGITATDINESVQDKEEDAVIRDGEALTSISGNDDAPAGASADTVSPDAVPEKQDKAPEGSASVDAITEKQDKAPEGSASADAITEEQDKAPADREGGSGALKKKSRVKTGKKGNAPKEINRVYIEDCGSNTGYWDITYSDGTHKHIED